MLVFLALFDIYRCLSSLVLRHEPTFCGYPCLRLAALWLACCWWSQAQRWRTEGLPCALGNCSRSLHRPRQRSRGLRRYVPRPTLGVCLVRDPDSEVADGVPCVPLSRVCVALGCRFAGDVERQGVAISRLSQIWAMECTRVIKLSEDSAKGEEHSLASYLDESKMAEVYSQVRDMLPRFKMLMATEGQKRASSRIDCFLCFSAFCPFRRGISSGSGR